MRDLKLGKEDIGLGRRCCVSWKIWLFVGFLLNL